MRSAGGRAPGRPRRLPAGRTSAPCRRGGRGLGSPSSRRTRTGSKPPRAARTEIARRGRVGGGVRWGSRRAESRSSDTWPEAPSRTQGFRSPPGGGRQLPRRQRRRRANRTRRQDIQTPRVPAMNRGKGIHPPDGLSRFSSVKSYRERQPAEPTFALEYAWYGARGFGLPSRCLNVTAEESENNYIRDGHG